MFGVLILKKGVYKFQKLIVLRAQRIAIFWQRAYRKWPICKLAKLLKMLLNG